MRTELGSSVTIDTETQHDSHARSVLDVHKIRRDFPALDQMVHGRPLIYLDNAATTQKPNCVVDAICKFYREDCANVHRGVHELSARATRDFEGARGKVQRFLNAGDAAEIVFTRGTTEAINLVAQTFGRTRVHTGDEVLISAMEHHSNIVPWQMLCQERGAKLVVAPINENGELLMDELTRLISPKTKLLAITHVSNALGTINPLREIIDLAHGRDVPVLIDGAQATPHLAVDVRELDCDFYTLSGHKMYGPTGIGALYGKKQWLVEMPPYQGGGDMIRSVTFEKTIYNDVPYKFEAGTPNIAGVIGLGAAIDYLLHTGLDAIAAYEQQLVDKATRVLSAMPGVRIIGTAEHKASVVSFTLDGVHPHDIGTILDREGLAIRTGHHCAQPVMDFFNVPATARASFGLYNTLEEVDTLAESLERVMEVFG